MNMKNVLLKLGVILTVIVAFASCEEDFNPIDSDILNPNFQTPNIEFPVRAYSKKLGPVQTNGLLAYQLGIYDDATYGKSTVNLVSQLTLSTPDPDFGDCTVLDSVVLYLPYFSTSSVDDEVTTYETDSIFGNSPIDINIYESNLLLRDFDPTSGFEEAQRYYSDLGGELAGSNVGPLLATIDNVTPDNSPVVLNDTVSLAPGLRVRLPNDFFQEKIIDNEGEPELLTNNNFREFLRGLYFEVTSDTDAGTSFLFDLADIDDANIGVTLYTTYKTLPSGETCEENTVERQFREVRLFFNANSVNLHENEALPAIIDDALENPNVDDGEERLYVRGGEGVVTIIDLFGEDVFSNDGTEIEIGESDDEEDLADLREEEWIINEANLIFYVDQDQIQGGNTEPERIIIFETKNQRVLADYSLDITGGNAPVDAITEHLGRLERGSDEVGEFYKIKLTAHLSNLINRDSLNVPLGLIVSQNVSQLDFQDLETPIDVTPNATNDDDRIFLERVPATSILSPEGTVLHGNLSSDVEKRLKLQIFYTKPE